MLFQVSHRTSFPNYETVIGPETKPFPEDNYIDGITSILKRVHDCSLKKPTTPAFFIFLELRTWQRPLFLHICFLSIFFPST